MSTQKDYKPPFNAYEEGLRRDAQVSEQNLPVLIVVIVVFVIGMALDGILTLWGVL